MNAIPKTFTKSAGERAIAHEVAGLEALSQAARHGGAPVARIAATSETSLATYAITETSPTVQAAREFGARLAFTHAYSPAGKRVFGEEPPTFPARFGHIGHMGSALLPMVPADSPARTFGEFYAEDRLLPYVEAALKNGAFHSGDAEVIERLAQRLRDGVFDAPQPHLVHTDAALLHGDLWAGNLLWARADSMVDGAKERQTTGNSGPIGVVIDPACHGGHAESDLAQLHVFGARHVEHIYAGYNEASPLAEGWQERIGLHKLHILIIHAALFGGSYGSQTIRTAKPYL